MSFYIKNKKKSKTNLSIGDYLYNSQDNLRSKVIGVENVKRYNKAMKRYELREGYVYENQIK